MKICSILLLCCSFARASYFSSFFSRNMGGGDIYGADNKKGCSPSSVLESLGRADLSLMVYINGLGQGNDKGSQYFRANVKKVYNGCGIEHSDTIFLKGAQGVDFNLHSKYLVFGFLTVEHIYGYNKQQLVLNIEACEANKPFYRVSWAERRDIRGFQSKSCEGYDHTTPTGLGERIFGDANNGVISGPETGSGYDTNDTGLGERIFGGANNGLIPGGESTNPGPEIGSGGGGYDSNYDTGSNAAYAPEDKTHYYGGTTTTTVDSYSSKSCEKADCGSLPYGSQSTLCPDGETTSGITGNCVYNPSAYKCEWEVQVCPTCSSDLGCRSDQICVDGFCSPAECLSDTGCPASNQFCEAGRCKTCYCDAGTPLSLCPDQLTLGGGHADECVYVDGACKREYIECPKCTADASCLDGQICTDGFCHPAQCSADENCADDEVCDSGRCKKCQCGNPRSPFECHDLNGRGDEAGACLRGAGGQCDYEYSQCDQCSNSNDCSKLNNGICVNGQCESAQCVTDSHCADNEVCEDYYCVPCDCGQPDRAEFLCHDLVGYGNVAGDCSRAANGQCVFQYSACDECSTAQDCSQLKNGICVNGQCESAQCLSDIQCEYNEVCSEDYICLACDCGQPDRTEFLCHHLNGYGDRTSDCFRADNGQCVFEYSECGQCTDNIDCSKLPNGICVNGQCESAQCLSDNECEYNEVCGDDYTCLPCNCGQPDRAEFLCHHLNGYGDRAGDCFRSDNGQCVFEYSECGQCTDNIDCSKLPNGICVNGQCESAQCLSDNECEYNEVCEDYACLPCNCGQPDRAEFLCHHLNGYGDRAGDCFRADNGQCVFEYSECGQCTDNIDCSKVPNGICVNGQCESAQCLSDNECEYNEVCGDDYTCLSCNCGQPDRAEFLCHHLNGYGDRAGDCFRADNGQCLFEYSECGQCTDNIDCSKLPNGICVNGQCESAQCLSDNECADNEVCEDYTCLACNCGQPDRAEFLCHDLIGYGDRAGNCFRADNGQCVLEYSECEQCNDDMDCSELKNGICVNGQCESAQCLGDNECKYNEVCEDYTCLTCDCGQPDKAEFLCHDLIGYGDRAGDCFRANNGQCIFEYSECEQCNKDQDCSQLKNGICANGQCESAQCLSDNECQYNEVCEDYTCLACNCGNPDRPEFLCHDLIGYGDVAGDCFRADNGQCIFEYSECGLCTKDQDCFQVDKGMCINGQCESAQCLVDDHCDHGFACEHNECVAAPISCQTSYQCPYEAKYCLGGYCSAKGCTSNSSCRVNEVCADDGHCRKKTGSY